MSYWLWVINNYKYFLFLNNIYIMNNLWNNWFQIFDELSKKPRAWWIRKEVWIPLILCESVLEHSLNVERACKALIIWDFQKIDNKISFSDMWKYHDILEYDMPDITPHCWISNEEKLKMELNVLSNVKNILWNEWNKTIDLIQEYLNQKTNDSKLLTLLDKTDAWIKALEYEKLWFKNRVKHFHPYVLEKLNENEKLKTIYQILLEREFSSLNFHFQYFTLLELSWDYDKFRNKMINIK